MALILCSDHCVDRLGSGEVLFVDQIKRKKELNMKAVLRGV